ncbi:hypothetical protein H6G00_21825 [Leptolyngbya sp. FACHB-541]|uniref:hypothetical protein n=1 Tax=Leptolyngbya sp. FACHB-541 TaxID=2692810 RepID=UPI0016848901|nr:hypothetical protein [Leptolyngbya sp. FACHB-541]MBD1999220.1 hypothetical protein [Leptolyngbya sp. FACHB-541]
MQRRVGVSKVRFSCPGRLAGSEWHRHPVQSGAPSCHSCPGLTQAFIGEDTKTFYGSQSRFSQVSSTKLMTWASLLKTFNPQAIAQRLKSMGNDAAMQ